MKGLIISSGSIKDYKLLEDLVDESDYIVCADGGLDHIIRIDKIANVLLGDLDSISDLGLEFIREKNLKVVKFPCIKDYTDTELAIKHLLDMGIDDITLIGGTGTRLDHVLANIFLLRKFNRDGKKFRIIDANNIINYVIGSMEIKGSPGKFVSVIPLNDEGALVSLIGFEYPLDHRHIEFASTLGVSNRVVDEVGLVRIHKGEALVFESLD